MKMINFLLNGIGIILIVISSIFFVVLFEPLYGEAKLPSRNDYRIQYFGCVDYITTFHCDPLHNTMAAYAYRGHSTRHLFKANMAKHWNLVLHLEKQFTFPA